MYSLFRIFSTVLEHRGPTVTQHRSNYSQKSFLCWNTVVEAFLTLFFSVVQHSVL